MVPAIAYRKERPDEGLVSLDNVPRLAFVGLQEALLGVASDGSCMAAGEFAIAEAARESSAYAAKARRVDILSYVWIESSKLLVKVCNGLI